MQVVIKFYLFILILQSNSNGSNIFGTMEFVRDMGNSSHWGLMMAPGQEKMVIICRNLFDPLYFNCMNVFIWAIEEFRTNSKTVRIIQGNEPSVFESSRFQMHLLKGGNILSFYSGSLFIRDLLQTGSYKNEGKALKRIQAPKKKLLLRKT